MMFFHQSIKECVKRKFNILIYSGPNREKSLKTLSEYDIVLASYQTVSHEHLNFESQSSLGHSGKSTHFEKAPLFLAH